MKLDDVAVVSSAAGAALEAGDFQAAKRLFRLAAEALQGLVPTMRAEAKDDHGRLLAATEFFKGGHYADARMLCAQINPEYLPADYRKAFWQLCSNIVTNTDPLYQMRIRTRIANYYSALICTGQKEYANKVLRDITNAPYCWDDAQTNEMRDRCYAVLVLQTGSTTFVRKPPP